MNELRPTSDHDRAMLKAASDRAIRRAGGGAVFAGRTRVLAAALSRYKADHEDAFMPIDVAVDADMAAGQPIILAAIAALEGYAITPLTAPGRAAPTLSAGLVGVLIRETGEVSAAVLEALADDHLSPAERKAIEKELDEALAALWQLRAALRGE